MAYLVGADLMEGYYKVYASQGVHHDLSAYKSVYHWLHMQLAERHANGLSIVWKTELGQERRYGDDAHVPSAYIGTPLGI